LDIFLRARHLKRGTGYIVLRRLVNQGLIASGPTTTAGMFSV
jgi:hypothetical protein